MTLTAIVGALMALVPARRAQTPEGENRSLARSHERLIDHIERLEREILIEQHLCAHWKEQAMRHAREAREEREAQERLREQNTQLAVQLLSHQPLIHQHNPLADPGHAHGFQQAQALANQQAQQQLAQYQALAMPLPYCNCVPSRSQVWAAAQGGE